MVEGQLRGKATVRVFSVTIPVSIATITISDGAWTEFLGPRAIGGESAQIKIDGESRKVNANGQRPEALNTEDRQLNFKGSTQNDMAGNRQGTSELSKSISNFGATVAERERCHAAFHAQRDRPRGERIDWDGGELYRSNDNLNERLILVEKRVELSHRARQRNLDRMNPLIEGEASKVEVGEELEV